jgi:hypothetical protein
MLLKAVTRMNKCRRGREGEERGDNITAVIYYF